MKPQHSWSLRVKPTSKEKVQILKEHRSLKDDQLRKAIQFCHDNNCHGWKAVMSGQFPLIKDERTVNKRLDGLLGVGDEKEHCQVLTNLEEKTIVAHIQNRNRSLNPMGHKVVTELIFRCLQVRKHIRQKSHGRVGKALSDRSTNALQKGKLSKSFWKRLMVAHPSLVIKRCGAVSVNRATRCTRNMAVNHLDALQQN